ncbi:hypothetical protein DL766_001683 [Monosporascus sp. MC13-8B]|uniref:DUF2828 domain-containing protein n=1 Tax=Monosporascus cannonballus TaxID=155416 RepID=A0ABY0H9G3_9PEZI|nr:hypothetical protein DL762_005450 [Monosporascus cannonballus]RYO90185.1 hypothetical protein DL763_005426 [Monosporascus cannonballus]RYP37109.1 hypothetical protein DL766_001683 [Monosporascus sp. MC13-8B]
MATEQEPWYLKSTFPVLFPSHAALTFSEEEFDVFLTAEISQRQNEAASQRHLESSCDPERSLDENFTLVRSAGQFTTADLREAIKEMGVWTAPETTTTGPDTKDDETPTHPFIAGLKSHDMDATPEPQDMENKMFTENGDLANRSTRNPVVDLFSSLEKVISGPHLFELLSMAWAEDPLMTLKVIFNARSIHLGKTEKVTFYRCAGWLAQNHPLTLISNLRWLSRPVIEKKVDKEDEDMVIVESRKDEDDVTHFDVRNGVSHGYWKDLLNILALSANELLTVVARPEDILNIVREKGGKGEGPKPDKDTAKAKRHDLRDGRHRKALERFNSDAVHRTLHIAIARLFAEQLKSDLALLRGDDLKAKKRISLCAKWAPSHDRFHDKHTFIVSTIAELLYPMVGEMNRELYLRHARESYRKDISSLRDHLDVVERKLSAKTLDTIKYDRVPSVAMKNYTPIFAKKNSDRFETYLDQVAEGKMRISGATLLPSTLINAVRQGNKARYNSRLQDTKEKVADGQWKTLVQRIKDSGSLESSIAVCDVSDSMTSPVFRDGTCPMDSAIGLSLLLAEATSPPFGGAFITFSDRPTVETVDLSLPLHEKYKRLNKSNWSVSTNFVAVFEDLILPMAQRNKLKPEDMVKRVFVFSDMQFDAAQGGSGGRWTTAFERVKRSFADAGYEMPQLVFWNLAGGRAGYGYAGKSWHGGDPVLPKPVTVTDEGTAIVSGYSKGMMKVFLDNGSFEDAEDEDGAPVKKQKIDPLSTVKRAVGHKAYNMLKVVD